MGSNQHRQGTVRGNGVQQDVQGTGAGRARLSLGGPWVVTLPWVSHLTALALSFSSVKWGLN